MDSQPALRTCSRAPAPAGARPILEAAPAAAQRAPSHCPGPPEPQTPPSPPPTSNDRLRRHTALPHHTTPHRTAPHHTAASRPSWPSSASSLTAFGYSFTYKLVVIVNWLRCKPPGNSIVRSRVHAGLGPHSVPPDRNPRELAMIYAYVGSSRNSYDCCRHLQQLEELEYDIHI